MFVSSFYRIFLKSSGFSIVLIFLVFCFCFILSFFFISLGFFIVTISDRGVWRVGFPCFWNWTLCTATINSVRLYLGCLSESSAVPFYFWILEVGIVITTPSTSYKMRTTTSYSCKFHLGRLKLRGWRGGGYLLDFTPEQLAHFGLWGEGKSEYVALFSNRYLTFLPFPGGELQKLPPEKSPARLTKKRS